MTKTVFCVKLEKEEEALDRAPLPGELGQRLLTNVSKPGWRLWLDHQTMLINEKKLNPLDKETRQYLAAQTEQYFFGDGADEISGYVPPSE